MRRLNERNKTYLYFMRYAGTESLYTDNLFTGEAIPRYDNLTEARMVVGTPTGSASLEAFGINESYIVKAVTDDVNCPLSKDDIVWLGLGKLKPYDERTYKVGTPCIHNGEIEKLEEGSSEWRIVNYTHIVTRVAKSFGYITYTLKEVDYDYHAQPPEPTPSA